MQQQNSAQLQDLASEGMKTLREALRNPAFNEEVLSQWTKNLHQMEKVAQQPMKEAAQSLKSAAQSQNSREQDLAQAQEKEEETLKALQQMQQKVNQGLDDLQALTLSQRLRQVGGRQKKIESTLQANIPDTIGLVPGELASRYQRANTQLAHWQTEAQGESTKLQGEISRFYERTQKPNYGEVTKEMGDAKPTDELDRVRGLIQDNIGMEAMQNLALWADKFEGWAAKLEPMGDDKEGGGSGQGSGSEQDDSALKQLLGLLRIREKQVNIQERTRLLHEHIDEKTAYRDGAVLLAASEGKLGRDLSKQAVENPYALLEQPYSDAMTSMTDVETLLDRPRTDQVTRSAEDKSLSMLSDLVNLLNEQAKKGSGGKGSKGEEKSGEEMAFLMQAMAPQPSPGMKAGQSPGANMNGGTTDKAGQAASGNVAGKQGDERSVKKSSSLPQNYPTEFRDALQNYFKALEQTETK
jgi:aryl carrier-like protein